MVPITKGKITGPKLEKSHRICPFIWKSWQWAGPMVSIPRPCGLQLPWGSQVGLGVGGDEGRYQKATALSELKTADCISLTLTYFFVFPEGQKLYMKLQSLTKTPLLHCFGEKKQRNLKPSFCRYQRSPGVPSHNLKCSCKRLNQIQMRAVNGGKSNRSSRYRCYSLADREKVEQSDLYNDLKTIVKMFSVEEEVTSPWFSFLY